MPLALPLFLTGLTRESQALSPQLIILRVVMGHGWSKATAARVTTGLVFKDEEKTAGTHTGTALDNTDINIGLSHSQVTNSALDSLVTPTSTKNAQTFA